MFTFTEVVDMLKLKHIIILSLVLSITFSNAGVSASVKFTDVDTEHPAYAAIIRVCEAGYLFEDTEGRFNPDNFIDKFDTAVSISIIVGFNTADAEAAYAEYAELLTYYAKTYTKWKSSADMAIAFLLKKGILSTDDIKSFVGIRSNGNEGLRALSKEEAAVFYVKAFGKADETDSAPITDILSDERSVSASARKFVYYIKSLGVPLFSEKNAFSPKSAITKAELAILIDCLMGNSSNASAPSQASQQKAEESKTQNEAAAESKPSEKPSTDDMGLTITGKLVQIRINRNGTFITIADGNKQTEYKVLTERVDVFSLVIDSYVKVYLDSYKAELVCGVEPASDIEAKG